MIERLDEGTMERYQVLCRPLKIALSPMGSSQSRISKLIFTKISYPKYVWKTVLRAEERGEAILCCFEVAS